MLWTYKQGQPEYAPVLAALVQTYLHTNAGPISRLLDFPPHMLAIVPSKRPGVTFGTQPLLRALARVAPLLKRLANTLACRPRQTLQRFEYNPDVFGPGPTKVKGKRVLLIDDTWVTGATAMSAAGALQREGATKVAILVAARMVDASFWPETHPYRQAMQRPYDPAEWPR